MPPDGERAIQHLFRHCTPRPLPIASIMVHFSLFILQPQHFQSSPTTSTSTSTSIDIDRATQNVSYFLFSRVYALRHDFVHCFLSSWWWFGELGGSVRPISSVSSFSFRFLHSLCVSLSHSSLSHSSSASRFNPCSIVLSSIVHFCAESAATVASLCPRSSPARLDV